MARPRQPAQILELRGAYKTHPERRRHDAEGAGPFNAEPPEHLHPTTARAWRWIVPRLPHISFTSSDEVAIEGAARVLAAIWQQESTLGPLAGMGAEFTRLHGLLLRYLGALGMEPRARATLATSATLKPRSNPFTVLRDMGDEP